MLGFNYDLNIDGITMLAKLNLEQLDYLSSRFVFDEKTWYQSKYKFELDMTSIGVYIKAMPHNQQWKHNFEIQLKAKWFDPSDNPSVILDILDKFSDCLSIVRLDLAWDYKTKFSASAIMKRHGKQSDKYYDTSYRFGSADKAKLTLTTHYDREVDAIAKNKPIQTFEFPNRFETKLRFHLNECTIHKINHDLIVDKLRKETILPHIKLLKADKSLLLLKNEKTAKQLKESLSPYKWQQLRKHAISKREPLEWYYIDSKDDLYDSLIQNDDFYFTYDDEIKELIYESILNDREESYRM